MLKIEKAALQFLARYPGKWHSFAADRATVETVCALHNRGDAIVNEYGQFKSTAQGLRNASLIA